MPFIDFEDLDHMLDSILTPNPDSRELGLSLSDSLSIEPAETDAPPPRFWPLRRNHYRRPIGKAPTPYRTRSRAFSAPQRLTQPIAPRPCLMPFTPMGFSRILKNQPDYSFNLTASRAVSQSIKSWAANRRAEARRTNDSRSLWRASPLKFSLTELRTGSHPQSLDRSRSAAPRHCCELMAEATPSQLRRDALPLMSLDRNLKQARDFNWTTESRNPV